MANLVYSTIASLDGYVADPRGAFDWAAPDEEVHAFVNELERAVGTYLYGRRRYEVMAGWETLVDDRPVMRDFAETWRSADKVVYSTTLDAVDELHLFAVPVLVGGGTRTLPDGRCATLDLLDERRFGSGVVHLHYRLV